MKQQDVASYRLIEILAGGWVIVGLAGAILGLAVFPVLVASGILH